MLDAVAVVEVPVIEVDVSVIVVDVSVAFVDVTVIELDVAVVVLLDSVAVVKVPVIDVPSTRTCFVPSDTAISTCSRMPFRELPRAVMSRVCAGF